MGRCISYKVRMLHTAKDGVIPASPKIKIDLEDPLMVCGADSISGLFTNSDS